MVFFACIIKLVVELVDNVMDIAKYLIEIINMMEYIRMVKARKFSVRLILN